MLLSFVIPLYNCEQYIETCLESIYRCRLDLSDFEVIVIDDGSIDNGLGLVTQYALNYKNLVFRSFANAGVSEARNRGLEIAKGDYVWFVDADDSICPNDFAKVLDCIKQNSSVDVICFNHTALETNGMVKVPDYKNEEIISGLDFLRMHSTMYIWDKIYKRSSIGNTRFFKGIRNTEDLLFNIEIMLNAPHVQIKTFFGYIYNQTNMYSTLSTEMLPNLLRNSKDTMLVHERLLQILKDQKLEEQRSVLASRLNFEVIAVFYAAFVDTLPNEHIKSMISKYKQMGLYPVVPSYNKKANVFAKLLNKERLFLLCVAIKRRLKHPKWM